MVILNNLKLIRAQNSDKCPFYSQFPRKAVLSEIDYIVIYYQHMNAMAREASTEGYTSRQKSHPITAQYAYLYSHQ